MARTQKGIELENTANLWNSMSLEDRFSLVKCSNKLGKIVDFQWSRLTSAERLELLRCAKNLDLI